MFPSFLDIDAMMQFHREAEKVYIHKTDRLVDGTLIKECRSVGLCHVYPFAPGSKSLSLSGYFPVPITSCS